MQSTLFAANTWLVNALLDDSYLTAKSLELAERPIPYGLESWLAAHFDAHTLSQRNEAQLEECFIGPLLAQLGWVGIVQQILTVQGKVAKPDWCLLRDPGQDGAFLASKDPSLIAAICESKAWGIPLDTGKADRTYNPHHQLQDYLSTLRVRFGFLTNGRFWRVYDTDRITARKTFLEFDLQALCALTDPAEKSRALALFAFFFGRDTYAPPRATGASTAIEAAIAESARVALEVEENLKAVIYGYDGEDSLFEILGRAIARANPDADLASVYQNSVVLLFRLLFIVYFEDKNRELLALHPFYQRYSLANLFRSLANLDGIRNAQHDGLYTLKLLFCMLDTGAPDIDVPLFNGGLFHAQRAPLLLQPKILDNATLRAVLEKLFFRTHQGNTLFDTRRDFRHMSVTHLGRIYEGLLEFRFARADQDAVYLEYETSATRGQSIEAYFDAYDAACLRKEKGFRALREIHIAQGEVYLKSANNSRKASASFYTPTALSQPLVQAAIDQARNLGKPLINLRILDNACGSGHFLVEALGYLTDLAMEQLDTDADLQQLVAEERSKIAGQLALLNLDYVPDDAKILKRALLKRCIFGVDLNPFAIELARLSLWMDTFLFGTPLSFIEHHIQHGNALLGASVQEFLDFHATALRQDDLFVGTLGARFDELRSVMQELDALHDTTASEVEHSKHLWNARIAPRLALLSRALSFVCTRRVLLAEGRTADCEALDKTPDLLTKLFDERGNPLLDQIDDMTRRFHFFHYEVAFPEAFAGSVKAGTNTGFDIIVGNPPWDKTKFADSDCFPQYHSNYRSLSKAQKDAVRKRLLAFPHIAAEYRDAQRQMEVHNEYYKAAFPLNKGPGDGNLFRLFVERNLALLNQGGSLSYVLPSALMFEEGSTILRKHLFTHCQVPFFYSFENRKAIFLDVHRSYKFAMVQVINTPPVAASADYTPIIDTAFYMLDPDDLHRPQTHIPYPLATIQALSPEQWALMELHDAADLPLLRKCYGAFPALSADWLDFRRELDMTQDRDLFIEQEAPDLLPLFEGKMIWQFSHLHAKPRYWLDPSALDERLRSKELHRMAQDLGLTGNKVAQYATSVRFDREFVRLALRAIASDTNERTLIGTLLPKHCGVGNSLNYCICKTYAQIPQGGVTAIGTSPLRLLFALAWFNSLIVDWIARQMIQINVNQTYLYRLPIPQPSDEAIRANPDYAQLARNAMLLTLASSWDDFADLAPLCAVQKTDVPTTAKARDKLRAHNDQITARLYGITPEEFRHILRSFPGMATKRPEYLTLLR
ncbi:Eco57I restriction-modification methylase domain-containing protein [Candidatus Symbiobacter mobilis]|uniref:site-specific DNA-methyltransferase (adenine-specific) n=1 Tax=Candidatus Symbiobacter mobilis CR TaxID=946483 RepID=U5N7M7_9BURK|nr:N-6 DNA methylase [Candidatus Symbiobacter mobilis]AGX87541.1 type II restriction enzyme methyltransferase subunit [Candidatus Symbiobacter mobilis CR]